MHKSTLLVVAFSAVLAACTRSEPAAEPVRAVRTLTVAADGIALSQEYAAEIRSRTESRLGFRVGGKIVRRAVNAGDTVKAGQLLAQLDAQDLRLGQDGARAAVVAAQVNYDQASADYKRFKELRDQGFISSAELERRDTALKAGQAQLDQARAQANMLGNQTAYANLVADVSGVVTGIDAEPGMVVVAGAPVLRLAHGGPRDAIFSVPEDQVARLRATAAQAGSIKVRLWGSAGDAVPATIREIAAAADAASRTFLVKVDIGGAPASLGQTATVVLASAKSEAVVKLPLSSLFEHQGKSAVWLLDKQTMTVRAQPIETAGADGNSVIVSSGLVPGAIVVTAGVHVLTPGQKVKIYGQPAVPVAVTTSAMR
jgi:multidrug efflux system membrane fusion protein